MTSRCRASSRVAGLRSRKTASVLAGWVDGSRESLWTNRLRVHCDAEPTHSGAAVAVITRMGSQSADDDLGVPRRSPRSVAFFARDGRTSTSPGPGTTGSTRCILHPLVGRKRGRKEAAGAQ
jgi:hypothetical protein